MANITAEIRNYVATRETVTLQEIVEFILVEKKISTSETYIYQRLLKVLYEQNKELKREKLVDYVRQYVKEKNNEVSIEEVIKYIKEKKIESSEQTIKITLLRVLKECDGTLKSNTISSIVRNYLATTNKPNLQDAIKYVRKVNEVAKISTIKSAWFRVKTD